VQGENEEEKGGSGGEGGGREVGGEKGVGTWSVNGACMLVAALARLEYWDAAVSSVLQCAVCCSVLPCIAVCCCSVLQCALLLCVAVRWRFFEQCVAVCCSALQCVCSVLKCVAMYCM